MNKYNEDVNNIQTPLLYLDDIVLINTKNNKKVIKKALDDLKKDVKEYNLKIQDDKLKIKKLK